jgi:hypothetical protein
VKSTPTRGVKQFLKPDTYKQSKPVLQIAVASLKASFDEKKTMKSRSDLMGG